MARLITYPAARAGRRFDVLVKPLVVQRLGDSKARRANPGSVAEPLADMLQWLVDDALDKQDEMQQTPEALCARIGLMNLVSVHNTGGSAVDAIFNLSHGPKTNSQWQRIREEVDSVMAKHGGVWSKQAIQDLEVINSAMYESLRITSQRAIVMERLVVAKEGVTLPTGEYLVSGTSVAMASAARQRDSSMYNNAEKYNMLRFFNEAKNVDAELEDAETTSAVGKYQPFTQPTKDFLAWGYGSHAWFFAAQEIKVLIALISTKYDIKPFEEPPSRINMGVASLPKTDTKLFIRRRSA